MPSRKPTPPALERQETGNSPKEVECHLTSQPMATEDFSDCLFTENLVDVQVVNYSDYMKDEVDIYEDSSECLIVSDEEHGDTFTLEEMSSDVGSDTLTLITLADGTQAYVGPHDLSRVELDDDGTLLVQEYTTGLAEGHQIQLDDGTFATLHATPKDSENYQAVSLEDGTTSYISLSDLARSLENSEEDGSMPSESPSAESPPEEQQPVAAESGTKERTTKCFQCPVENCGKLYTTLHHLKVHQRAHTGDRPFRCPEEGCNKAFATGYGCKAHVRTHTGEKPYKCPDSACIKCFKTSGDLQKHIRVHTGERPFMCPVPECGRSFTTSNIRKVHYRTHTGERPYNCSVENCGRAFASATNYKNHMRIHSGEKPYKCSSPGCDKRFTEYSSLYKHNLVHTQQKPYHCTSCDRNYRQASTLTMHKRTAHGIVETDDGTEIILGETVFTFADTEDGGTRLKALGSNLLGYRGGNRIMAVHASDGTSTSRGQQFLVVTDSAQLAACQELELGTASFLKGMKDVDEDDLATENIFPE